MIRIDVEVIYHFVHSFTMGVLHGYRFVDASPMLSSQWSCTFIHTNNFWK